MKVLLVTPHDRRIGCSDKKRLQVTRRHGTGHSKWMPLGPCSIAAVLHDKGHTVRLFDRPVENHKARSNLQLLQERMKACIQEFKPDVIGFSTTSRSIYDTVLCVDFVRSFFTGMIVAGGYHTTAMPEETLRKIPGIDAVVAGEGEYSMLRLAEGERASIPGVVWRESAGTEAAAPDRINDLDNLPFPDMDILDIDYYTEETVSAIRGFNLRCVSLLSSRGCTNRCSFCSESLTFGRGVRYHSPHYVVENVEQAVKRYRINGIYFHDNNFLSDQDRAAEICRKMISKGFHKKVKWCIQARSDHINPEIVKELKRAGCVKIETGIESMLQANLDGVGKKVSCSRHIQALKQCRKHGMKVHGYFMNGFTNESIQSLEEELDYMKKLPLDSVLWSELTVNPGTKLYEEVGDDFFAKNAWTQENIEKFYSTTLLSPLPQEEKRKWMARHYAPYTKWKTRFSLLRNNGPLFMFKRFLGKRRNQGAEEKMPHEHKKGPLE